MWGLLHAPHRPARKPARNSVEHDLRALESIGDTGEDLPYRFRLEVHEKPLGDDEHAKGRIDRVHPRGVERADSDVTEAIGRHEEVLSHTDCICQVHGQPAQATVVDASDLRFEALAKGYDEAIRMAFEPPS